MRFKVDENLPTEIADDLRARGHDAATVHEEGLAGTQDTELLPRVRGEGRVFITMDKGVADVRAYPPDEYPGLVLLRPADTGRGEVLAFARRNLPSLLEFPLQGRLFVVTDRGIRSR
ncbi:MAG: DUF5615 family PIN-like protein [Phycisphaerales bacterium]|nr:DUF5615 family PIN-like protein [Phycisphaerales bacterium]